MPQTQLDLQELLAYEESHAPWFSLNEDLPHALLKRNLKLLRGLSGSSKTTLEELDRLSAQEIKDAITDYKTLPKDRTNKTETPKTIPQFFQSLMAKSSYFSEIIPYTSDIQNSPMKPQSTTLTVSKQTNPETVPQKNTASIHGFHLNKEEAFSSTRYFSEDKKSYAQIIAKDGTFQATHKNLNHEQKTDLAFEMSFQFLLNLPPERKTITIDGPPDMVHRVRAAMLYLQKEAGPRYEHLTFNLPEGMSIAPEELNDAYIKKHLGELNETPQQIVQFRQFLKMDTSSPTNTNPITPSPIPTKVKPPLIDMERIFHAPDLSQQDKMLLNEYQSYLKDTWVDGLKDDKGRIEYLISEHEEFMQRTEKVLNVLKKAPSLEREFEALKMLYVKTMESHHKTLESVHKNEWEYETRIKELMPEVQKTRRQALESCVHSISEHLQIEIKRNTNLSEELRTNLLSHAQNMQEITNHIHDKEVLPDEVMRSYGAQMIHALNCLEHLRDYSKSPLFQQMKECSKKLSETKEKSINTTPEQIMQASNHVKERLHQFKKEFQEPKASEVLLLDPKTNEQLLVLIKQTKRCINKIEPGESRLLAEQLLTLVQQVSDYSTASTTQIDVLHKCIDDILPHIQENHQFVHVLSQIKTLIAAPPIVDVLSHESNTALLQGIR